MASININKLRFQIADLVAHFSDPDLFYKCFLEIMDQYSQRSLRKGSESTVNSFLPTFNCPDQVINQIIIGLQDKIRLEPVNALHIADQLWMDRYLESHELAALILGHIPTAYSSKVLDRIILWASPELDGAALKVLFAEATRGILKQDSKVLEDAIAGMLDKQDIEMHKIGLEAILSLINNQDFDRFPILFKLITPFILESGDEIVHLKTLAVLIALIKRTPIESAYYLKQSLAYSESNQVEGIIRRLIPNFPPDLRQSLLDAINQRGR